MALFSATFSRLASFRAIYQDRPDHPLEALDIPVRGLAVPSKVRHTKLVLGGRDLVDKLGQGAITMRQGGGHDAAVSIGYGLAWAKKSAVYTLGGSVTCVSTSLAVCVSLLVWEPTVCGEADDPLILLPRPIQPSQVLFLH